MIVYDGIGFMMQLFEPKFIGLVNDNEQHFIMCGQVMLITFRKLSIQDLIQLQIVVVMYFCHIVIYQRQVTKFATPWELVI